jgi:ribosomal protein L20A (L18A)
LSCKAIAEKNPNIVKNYGITIRYNSRSGTHNMYREYRDTRLAGAVEQMYADMAGRHRARFHSIHIVDVVVVKAGVRAAKRYNPELHGDVAPEAVVRPQTKEFTKMTKFPLAHRIQRAGTKAKKATYVAARPTTFFHCELTRILVPPLGCSPFSVFWVNQHIFTHDNPHPPLAPPPAETLLGLHCFLPYLSTGFAILVSKKPLHKKN